MQLSYANVTATLALFIALGGTSYAVTKLPRNSVGSAQVRDGSLQSKDLSRGIARGPRGVQGPPGTAGAAGAPGPSSIRVAPPGAAVTLPGATDIKKEVRRMADVPAGDWNLRFFGSPRLGAEVGLHVFCDIKVNGDVVGTNATVVGNYANASQEAGLPIETAVSRTTPFNVTVECSQNSPSTPAVVINRPQIIATRVGEIVTTP